MSESIAATQAPEFLFVGSAGPDLMLTILLGAITALATIAAATLVIALIVDSLRQLPRPGRPAPPAAGIRRAPGRPVPF